MERVVIFVCMKMQLPIVLCYCYGYNMMFLTIFKIKHKLCRASGSATSIADFWVRTWLDYSKLHLGTICGMFYTDCVCCLFRQVQLVKVTHTETGLLHSD